MTLIKSIFIANNDEAGMPIASLMPIKYRDQEIFEDHGLADRYLFSGEDDRLLITPLPYDREFFQDTVRLLGYRNLINLNPKELSESTSNSILNDKPLMDILVKTIRENPGLKIRSHEATVQLADLVKYLKNQNLQFETPELPDNASLWTASFFDTKSGFRQIMPYLGKSFPSMPMGSVCYRREDIIGWAAYLIKTGDGCVMKSDHGQGGLGLKIIRSSELLGKDIEGELNKMLENEAFWLKDPVVVERFIEPDKTVCGGAPNVEAKIDGEVETLYVCGMRISDKGVFQGVEMGKDAVPGNVSAILNESGLQFGRFLKGFGYKGFYEIDFVNDKAGHIYPIEANIRRTGGTHSYELGKYLLGSDFLKNFYLVVNNFVFVEGCKGKTYKDIKQTISPLLYPIHDKSEGVIITITNLLIQGYIGYIVVANSRERTYELERKFLESFK